MKAAFAALGGDPDRARVPILQFVHLVEGTERRRSPSAAATSSRSTSSPAVGVDATRFFMLQRSHDRTVDLDLDSAPASSPERTPSTTSSTRTPGASRCSGGSSSRASRRRSGRRMDGGRGREAAALEDAERALVRRSRVPRRGRRGGRATRAAPDRGLRARARPAVHRVLPRLQGDGARAPGRSIAPDRALAGGAAGDRAVAVPARGQRARLDVGIGSGWGGWRSRGCLRSAARRCSSASLIAGPAGRARPACSAARRRQRGIV